MGTDIPPIQNPVEHFRAAIRDTGLDHAGPIVPDSKLHRFRAGDDKAPNSWYVLYPGPPAAGAFGCWKRGIKETWCENRKRDFTDSEWRSIRHTWKSAEAERERAEAERRAEATKAAARALARAQPADPSHPYLLCKRVGDCPGRSAGMFGPSCDPAAPRGSGLVPTSYRLVEIHLALRSTPAQAAGGGQSIWKFADLVRRCG
jgi:putative DNA primase/helicase